MKDCPVCNGKGHLEDAAQAWDVCPEHNYWVKPPTCPWCDETGKVSDKYYKELTE